MSVARKGKRRTTGQMRYDEVVHQEQKIRELLDEIPYSALGRSPATCRALDNAETHLQDAVAELQKAWDEEVPRYERSAEATAIPGKEAQS